MPKSGTVDELLRACAAEKEKGADFPSIWNTILKRHPLVFGAPVQVLEDGRAKLSVPLITGQGLVCDDDGFAVVWAPDARPTSLR